MTQPKLFDTAPYQGPTTKAKRRAECETLKVKYGIWTHSMLDHDVGATYGHLNWLAMSMPECTQALAGYKLTTEEKTIPIAMIAGYCRLLDDAGMIEQGHKTEFAAVTALAIRLDAKAAATPPPPATP